MIYIFEDGRMLFSKDLLRETDAEKYLEIEELPSVLLRGNQYAVFRADLKLGKVVWEIFEKETAEEPEIPQKPTPNPLELISEQLKALSQKYENDQGSTQEMILTLASAIAEVYEILDAEASK